MSRGSPAPSSSSDRGGGSGSTPSSVVSSGPTPSSVVPPRVAVGLLLIRDAPTDKGPYGGELMVLCSVFVLISGLLYWTSHSHDCVRKFVGHAWGR